MKRLLIILVLLGSGSAFGQTLEELEVMALKGAPTVAISEAEMAQAQTQLAQAGAWPALMIGAGVFAVPIETRLGAQRAMFSVQQRLPWPGQWQAEERAAEAVIDQASLGKDMAQTTALLTVRQAWMSCYLWRISRLTKQEELAWLERLRRVLESKVQAGEVSLESALAVESRITVVTSELKAMEYEEAALQSQLEAAVGQPLSGTYDFPDSLVVPAWGTLDSAWLATPWAKRWEAKEAEFEARASQMEYMNRPQIQVGAQYWVIGAYENLNPEGNGRDALMLPQVGLSIPLSGRANRAKVAAQMAARDRAAAEKEQAYWNWRKSSTDAQVAYEQALERKTRFAALLQLATQRERLLTADLSRDPSALSRLLELGQEINRLQWQTRQAESDAMKAVWKAQYLLGQTTLK